MGGASAKYRLGQRIAKPPAFHPTAQWVSGDYIYRVDATRLICKRVPANWHRNKPVYFVVADSQGVPESNSGQRSRPKLHRPLVNLAFTSAFVAICLLVYPYYPEVKYGVERTLPQRTETQATSAVASNNQLLIPKIGVTANILEAPDLGILDREQGVWHQTGNLDGNFVLAAHRFKYLPPNTTTFYNLNKLEKGDTAIIDMSGKRYIYVVRDIKTVKAEDISVLNSNGTPQLTLYTCSDKRETERIVIHANLLP